MTYMQPQPPQPCRPFTECWCEQRPNHPRCSDVDNVKIDSNISILICLAFIIGLYKLSFKRKN